MHRILGIACEPWQTKIISQVLQQFYNQNQNSNLVLALTDFYHFVHNVPLEDSIPHDLPIKIITQNDIYKSWQSNLEEESELLKINLAKWEIENCKKRSLSEIESGNALTNQWEREAYWLPFSDYWRKRVLVDTIEWCENLMEESNPSVVISIERAELSNSVIDLICNRKKIPYLTLIPSRIESRWIVRTDFGYGCGLETQIAIDSAVECVSCQKEAKEYVKLFKNSHQGAYSSIAYSDSQIFSDRIDPRATIRVVKELKKLISDIYYRHIIVPKEMSIKPKRFEENHLRFTGVKIRRWIYRIFRSLGIKKWGVTRIPDKPYIFWALHGRPETSVMVLGDGKDEIELIEEIVKDLPAGYILAIKENPVMFGLRGKKFYKRLQENKRIMMIDAFMNTNQLIKSSSGVMGISGTVLLESAILGKPVCILGKPEFMCEFEYVGWNSYITFFNALQTKNLNTEIETATRYLQYIFHNSTSDDVPYFSEVQSANTQKMIRRFASILEYYSNNKKMPSKCSNK